MDKKFAQNVGIAPSSDMATTWVNSDIFVLTAVAIRYCRPSVVRLRQKVFTKSISRASKPSHR